VVKPLQFPLLTDENIHPGVVAALVSAGKDVRTVYEEGLAGSSDAEIIRHAFQRGRVIVTHDNDFGMLAIYANEPYVGIVFLRPGHMAPSFVLRSIEAMESTIAEVEPPFLLVAERRGDAVRIRLRR
jgi:predicted nuclease of predicted toxin-antitoxin system